MINYPDFVGTAVGGCVFDDRDPDEDRFFDYRYISKNNRIERLVFSILNEYEILCLRGNKGMLDNNIIDLLRGDALEDTWKQYGNYIEIYRKENQDDKAWQPCYDWLYQHRPRWPTE